MRDRMIIVPKRVNPNPFREMQVISKELKQINKAGSFVTSNAECVY